LDTTLTVKVAVALGARGFAWLPRLSMAAEHELALLDTALAAVPLTLGHDQRFVTASPSSAFHVSLVYATIRATAATAPPPFAEINWDNFAPTKVQIVFWLLRLGRTITRERLHRHGCLDTDICPFYPSVEDAEYLFVRCPRLQELWERVLAGLHTPTRLSSMLSSLASNLGLDEASTPTSSGVCGRLGIA